MRLAELRREYHRSVCQNVIRLSDGIPNMADMSNLTSKAIALRLVEQLGHSMSDKSA
jgi:hypothetical protein